MYRSEQPQSSPSPREVTYTPHPWSYRPQRSAYRLPDGCLSCLCYTGQRQCGRQSAEQRPGSRLGRQANGIDSRFGGVLVLLSSAPAAAYGTDEFTVTVDG